MGVRLDQVSCSLATAPDTTHSQQKLWFQRQWISILRYWQTPIWMASVTFTFYVYVDEILRQFVLCYKHSFVKNNQIQI